MLQKRKKKPTAAIHLEGDQSSTPSTPSTLDLPKYQPPIDHINLSTEESQLRPPGRKYEKDKRKEMIQKLNE